MASRRIQTATRRALVDAGRLGTPLGQSALALARAMDEGVADSALPGVAKELRLTLADATRAAASAADPIDELRRRRERRLGTA